MSKPLTYIFAAAAVVAGAPLAAAQQGKPIAAPTRAQVASTLQARFKVVDTNGDGSISTAEIDASNGRAAKEAEAAMIQRLEGEFAKLDTNKDKQLSLAEFKAGAPSAKPVPAAGALGRLDTNKDQKISLAEFTAIPLAAFDAIDTNKDGTLSAAEQEAARKSTR